jgi:hypothetical protein
MYRIIGGDGNEYGPISAEVLRQWYAEGRVNGETQVRQEGGGWLPMSAFPEFAQLTTQKVTPPPPAAPPTPPPFPAGPAAEPGPTPVPEEDYDLDIGGCIGRGWGLVKGQFGITVGGFCLYTLVMFGLGMLGSIPLIGGLFSIASLFMGGPMLGGLYYLYLRVLRGGPAQAGDLFAGFKKAFFQLFLGQLVVGLLVGLCLVPAAVTVAFVLLPALGHGQILQEMLHHQQVSAQEVSQQLAQVKPEQWALAGGVFLLCLVPAVFLKMSWLFTLPLIIDKELDFGAAMRTSWQRVNRHWWQVFGLVLVAAVVGALGLLACCVGVLVTAPIQVAAMMYAYETLFSGREV